MSTNAFTYEWAILGANPATSTAVSPDINLPAAGTYTIILKAINDKETRFYRNR
jgi:hypothetical protein